MSIRYVFFFTVALPTHNVTRASVVRLRRLFVIRKTSFRRNKNQILGKGKPLFIYLFLFSKFLIFEFNHLFSYSSTRDPHTTWAKVSKRYFFHSSEVFKHGVPKVPKQFTGSRWCMVPIKVGGGFFFNFDLTEVTDNLNFYIVVNGKTEYMWEAPHRRAKRTVIWDSGVLNRYG